MNPKSMLEACISDCNNSLSELRSLSQSVQNTRCKDELNRATQAINDCISHCQSAYDQL
ncbi:MAG: hypothetical protein VB084_04885 [Syntrophomonadaceae bacterium]|nr:hypothetical protein [Syntrophomonadaceae bacterium]